VSLLRVLPAPAESRDDESWQALLGEIGFSPEPAFALSCVETYHDTLDGRLFAAGLRLFRREAEEHWHLVENGAETAVEPEDPRFPGAAGRIAGRIAKLRKGYVLLPHLEVHRVEKVLRTRTEPHDAVLRWQEFTFRDPHEDHAAVGPRVLQLDTEAEVESNPFLVALVSRLNAAAREEFDTYTDGLSALDLPLPGAPVPDALRLNPGDTLGSAAIKLLTRQAGILRDRRRGALLDLDVEYVHQLRVAGRRAREVMRAFEPGLEPARTRAVREELRWLGDTLGRVRDMDVMLENLPAQLALTAAGEASRDRILDAFQRRRSAALEHARRDLKSSRFDRLVAELESPLPGTGAGTPILTYASGLIRKTVKRVRRWSGRPAGSLTAGQLHRIRIAIKRLRYVSEFLEDLPRFRFEKEISEFVATQDCLGESNDAAVAANYLRELVKVWCADGRPDADDVIAVGALIQLQTRKVESRRRRFTKLWKRFPKTARRLQRATDGFQGED